MVLQINHGAQFQALAQEWSVVIEERLAEAMPLLNQVDDPAWKQAVHAAVFDGGKRIRPVLTILGWQVSGARLAGARSAVLNVATAVEFIHCSSLVFDDLPCMDNATLRRGSKTLHLEFGEDKAILVALGLLLKGIELVVGAGQTAVSAERFGLLTGQLMNCIGPAGLICGQWIDICTKQSEVTALTNGRLAALRNLKTAPLIKFSLLGGAILGGATRLEMAALTSFADLIGEAYQLIDDLLDLVAGPECLGKDTALDLKNDRLNSALSVSADLMASNLWMTLTRARAILEENFPAREARAALSAFTDYLYGHLQSYTNF